LKVGGQAKPQSLTQIPRLANRKDAATRSPWGCRHQFYPRTIPGANSSPGQNSPGGRRWVEKVADLDVRNVGFFARIPQSMKLRAGCTVRAPSRQLSLLLRPQRPFLVEWPPVRHDLVGALVERRSAPFVPRQFEFAVVAMAGPLVASALPKIAMTRRGENRSRSALTGKLVRSSSTAKLLTIRTTDVGRFRPPDQHSGWPSR